MPDYQFSAVTSLEGIASLKTFWQSVQWHPNADYNFYQLIVQARSAQVRPYVLVVSHDQQPVTLIAARIESSKMPIRFGYLTLARVPVRQLVVIEGGFMGQQSPDIFEQCLGYLNRVLREQKLHIAAVDQVKLGSPLLDVAKRTVRRWQLAIAREATRHWSLQLPKTWDDFMKSRGKKHRYWLRRLENILNQEFPGEWCIKRYTSPAEAGEFVDAAETVAATTYHRSLGVGFQRNHENIQRIDLEAHEGRLRGYVLFIKNAPVAFWYCSLYQKTLHLCATGYNPSHRDYELGTVLLVRIFQEHCGTDIAAVDFGLGEAGYKQRFGSENFMETSFIVFANTPYGLALRLVNGSAQLATGFSKAILERLRITHRVKTSWRRRLELKHGAANGAEPAPASVVDPNPPASEIEGGPRR